MLKLITWNVNSIAVRLPRLKAVLEKHAPDVLCLQELKCGDESFPIDAVREAGYDAVTFGQKTYNGVAIVSRLPMTDVRRSFDDRVDDQAARFISAHVGGMTVASVYVPNGGEVASDKYYYKLNWLARLRRYLAREYRPEDPLVLAGDYNVAPLDVDVHDVKATRGQLLCSPPERMALEELRSFGLVDLKRRLDENKVEFTWWDYRMSGFARDHGMRIDLMLATETLAARARSHAVDRDERGSDKPSDHAPVLVEFDV